MFQQRLLHCSDVPVRQKYRNCTDTVCSIIGSLFSFTLFVMAFIMMNRDNIMKTNFPTDSDHNPCAYGENQQFAFVYFPNIRDASTRVCVSSCPTLTEVQLECKVNSKVPNCVSVNIYDSEENFRNLGGFCAPKNKQKQQILISSANLNSKFQFTKTYEIIHLALLFSFVLGLLWSILVQFFPKIMSYVAFFLASAFLIFFGILLLTDNAKEIEKFSLIKTIAAVIFIALGIFFIAIIYIYHRQLKMVSIFLIYGSSFLSQKTVNFIYTPIFISMSVGLFVLSIFQFLAFSSSSEPISSHDDIFLHTEANTVLTILVVIQFIWGQQFLKDSFNFILSGNATEWYMNEKRTNCCLSVSRLFKFNFGSVAGGSFLNAFFNLFSFLYQLLRCYPDGKCSFFAPCCEIFSPFCGCFLNLVRNDVYAYINLTGIPYCNASRNCEILCKDSSVIIGRQSVMFFYRLCSHIFCIGPVVFFSYELMKMENEKIEIKTLIMIIIFSYFLSTYFIDVHGDTAEGIQVSYLVEKELNGNAVEKISALEYLKEQLEEMQRNKDAGTC